MSWTYCCKDMSEAVEHGHITIAVDAVYGHEKPCFDSDGDDVTGDYEIKFCPLCGKEQSVF